MKFTKSISMSLLSIDIVDRYMDEFGIKGFSTAVDRIIQEYVNFKKLSEALKKGNK